MRPSIQTQRKSAPRALALSALTVIAVIAVIALALAPAASALSAPSVSTGSAHSVTYSSALVTGSVNPHGSETSYYVQYGPTKAYGAQSALAPAGAGAQSIAVSVALGGLQPLTQYHYRLVAVNAAGPSFGSDAAFLTPKVPLALTIVASPNPVPFGGAIVITGTLSGTGNGARAVVLQAAGFPFTTGFQNVGNPELTSASGVFSFPVLGLQLVTWFRVVTATSTPVISAIVVEGVAFHVHSHVARTKRAHFVRIFGTVAPAADAMQVAVLRRSHGRGVLACGTVLRHRNASSSSFSCVARAIRGSYRVLVRDTTGALSSTYGAPLSIG